MPFSINGMRVYIMTGETHYFDPQIPGVPERRGMYYTFEIKVVSRYEGVKYTDRIDWPIPLCTDPLTAAFLITRYFEREDEGWNYCWNWYLGGHDLYAVPDDDDDCTDCDDFCGWLLQHYYRIECCEPYIDTNQTDIPIHITHKGLLDMYPYLHLRPGFPAVSDSMDIKR